MPNLSGGNHDFMPPEDGEIIASSEYLYLIGGLSVFRPVRSLAHPGT